MENAKLGDAMIEKLRAHGTAAEKEKIDVMERLQEQAMALKAEQEEKLKLHMDAETLKAMAAAAEVRRAVARGVWAHSEPLAEGPAGRHLYFVASR